MFPGLREKLEALPPNLRGHCLRVQARCQELVPRLGLNPQRVGLCALGHDLARALPPSQLLAQARGYGLPIHPVEEAQPFLLHGPVAARLLKGMGLEDEEVLSAIAWHTTGRPGMSLLEEVIFLADKTEPEKARSVPELAQAWDLAFRDLDRALLIVLEWQIDSILKAGSPLHPASVEARDYIKRLSFPPAHP